MDTSIWLPIVFRGTERLLIIVIAGMCVYFGFRLFDRALINDADVEGQYGKIRIILRRVAPGTLFALFGAIVVSIGIWQSISISGLNEAQHDAQAQQSSFQVKWGLNPLSTNDQKAQIFDALLAINRILYFAETGAPKNERERQELIEVLSKLRKHRKHLINHAYGPNAYEQYESWVSSSRDDPNFISRLSPEDQKLYQEIKELSAI